MGTPIFVAQYVLPQIEGTVVLDLGCGDGLYGCLMRTCWWQTISGSQEPDFIQTLNPKQQDPDYIVGVEIDDTVIQKPKEHKIYDELIMSSAHKLPFKDNTFDTILCIEVIEHTQKNISCKVLAELDRCARTRIILTTPYRVRSGFLPPEELTTLHALASSHKSQISLKELRSRNYHILTPPGGKHPLRMIRRFLERKYLKYRYNEIVAVKKLYKDPAKFNYVEKDIKNILQCPSCKFNLHFSVDGGEEKGYCKNCKAIFHKKMQVWDFRTENYKF